MTRTSHKRKLETIILSDSEEDPSTCNLSQVISDWLRELTLLSGCLELTIPYRSLQSAATRQPLQLSQSTRQTTRSRARTPTPALVARQPPVAKGKNFIWQVTAQQAPLALTMLL